MARNVWWFLVILLLLDLGCSRKTVVRKYYWIDVPRVNIQVDTRERPLSRRVCEIEPVEVASPYNSPRIVLRSDSFEIQYFLHHHWVTTPSNAFTEILRYTLEDAELFNRVEVGSWDLRPQYRIRSEIRALEFIPVKDRGYAHLKMKLRLINLETGGVEIVHAFDRRIPLRRRNINEFTGAIATILQEELSTFYSKIAQYLTKLKE